MRRDNEKLPPSVINELQHKLEVAVDEYDVAMGCSEPEREGAEEWHDTIMSLRRVLRHPKAGTLRSEPKAVEELRNTQQIIADNQEREHDPSAAAVSREISRCLPARPK